MKPKNAELLKKIANERGYVLDTHKFLAKKDPDFLQVYNALFEHLLTKEHTLPIRTKELIVIAMLCSKGQYQAAKLRVGRALKYKATPREILEALEVAMLYSGAPTLIYGAETLIDHLRGTKSSSSKFDQSEPSVR